MLRRRRRFGGGAGTDRRFGVSRDEMSHRAIESGFVDDSFRIDADFHARSGHVGADRPDSGDRGPVWHRSGLVHGLRASYERVADHLRECRPECSLGPGALYGATGARRRPHLPAHARRPGRHAGSYPVDPDADILDDPDCRGPLRPGHLARDLPLGASGPPASPSRHGERDGRTLLSLTRDSGR